MFAHATNPQEIYSAGLSQPLLMWLFFMLSGVSAIRMQCDKLPQVPAAKLEMPSAPMMLPDAVDVIFMIGTFRNKDVTFPPMRKSGNGAIDYCWSMLTLSI